MILLLLVLTGGCAHHRDTASANLASAAPTTVAPAARAALEAGAEDLDVGVRRRAVGMLVLLDPAPAGGRWAERGRYDPSEYVRRATVEALVPRLAELETRTLLAGLVDDEAADPWSRGAAAIALADALRNGTVPKPEAAALRVRISSAAAAARGSRAAALLLAATTAGDEAARARLVEQLSSGNLPLELWFVHALGASGDQGLVAPLIEALDRVEPELRLPVAVALVELGEPAGARVLEAAFAEEEEMGLEAVELLAEAGPAADGVFAGVGDGPGIVRQAAALARFARGGEDSRTVQRALKSEDPELVLLAAQAAAQRLPRQPTLDGADALRSTLRGLLPEAGPGLQLAIAGALGGSTAAPDRSALATLLSDESTRVRVEAAASLAR